MIPVSDNWLMAQRQLLVPEAFIRIEALITDPDVQPDLTVSTTDEEYYSDTLSLVDEVDKKCISYTTLEDGLMLLDGNENYIESKTKSTTEYGLTGYVSDSMCDENCVFDKPIVINLDCSIVHRKVIGGINIKWSDTLSEYAVKYNISVWNDDILIAGISVNDNREVNSVLEFDFQDFNKITITIYEWCLPNKRARMEEVIIGLKRIWNKSDLMSYTHTSTCDLLSGALPKNEICFDLDNSNLIWDIMNLNGNEKYLIERQELKVYYGYELNERIEWIKIGNFYLSEWKVPSNGIKISLTARDLLTFMNNTYTGIKTGTLYDICLAAIEQAELPKNNDGTYKYSLSEILKDYETTIPDDSSHLTIAQVLQLCANAAMCAIWQDSKGVIRIEPRYLKLENYMINSFNSYSYPEFNTSKILKAVNVNNGLGEYVVNDIGETQTLQNDLITIKEQAEKVAQWVAENLKFRNTVSGSIRIDPRLEVTDLISVEDRFRNVYSVKITSVKETFNGMFKGNYEGRLYEFKPVEAGKSNDFISGELELWTN